MLLENFIFNESEETVQQFLDDVAANMISYGQERREFSPSMIRGKVAKRLFARYANKKFLNSLVTIHWAKKLESIVELLNNPSSTNDELSCNVVRNIVDIPSIGAFGRFGLVVKGHITFFANDMDDVYSGSYHGYLGKKDESPYPLLGDRNLKDKKHVEWFKDFLVKRKQTSGVNKVLRGGLQSVVLDQEDFSPNTHNEALVDHWKPLAVIHPPLEKREKEDLQKLVPNVFSGTSNQVIAYLLGR